MRTETIERVLAMMEWAEDAEPEDEASLAAAGIVFAAASAKRHDLSLETFLERCEIAWETLPERRIERGQSDG